MLLELNVKDIALVRKAAVSFGEGLNILTGETGTGKSVIIDSAMLALGGRIRGDIIRRGAENAYVELIFQVDGDLKAKLEETGINPDENGMLIISRKIYPGRSVSRINDETVTLGRLRETAALLLDIYGQNEYYTLMDRRQHLHILDEFMGKELRPFLNETADAYAAYRSAEAEAAGFTMDEKERVRRADLLAFELDEIDEAKLVPGEEEELAASYRRLSNARNILEDLNGAHEVLSGCDTGRAAASLEHALHYDDGLRPVFDELMDAQAILDSVLNDLRAYADGLETDESAFAEIEARLDLIRRLEQKYGQTIGEVLAYRDSVESQLRELEDYDSRRLDAERKKKATAAVLEQCCTQLSEKRQQGAEKLCGILMTELQDLGFEKPQFSMQFVRKAPGADGFDDAGFMAALNPGEVRKPLSDVASGGELSRVMLALKTILAETDEMPTLIFDEIDTGISGRTAQRVAEKLDVIGMRHQVICVSHLPQIAAMADNHFVIRKIESEGRNVTEIEKLDEEGSCAELARLLGGAEITKAVSENASEMRRLAKDGKSRRRKL